MTNPVENLRGKAGRLVAGQVAGSAVSGRGALPMQARVEPKPMVAGASGRESGFRAKRAARAAQRTCGSCRVCCRLPDIPELNKPRDTWCEHAVLDRAKPGCGRYETRPEVCRSFECGWLSGLGETQDRPDKLGVMWQPTVRADGTRVMGFVEVWPGALLKARVQRYLQLWSRTNPDRVFTRRAEEERFQAVQVTVNRASVGGRPRA